ncbi:hypothetical protein DEO72_LG8g2313 [Vigna unguiculata]|uniref:Uncharacterized protein n=1 Tax=Vigna unguiculata TaxID=3917 RepID=A0A4D6MT64_VIGUN|nr:hypothetical protein DEO72_LG8g2313 [Vigna unguiculata]
MVKAKFEAAVIEAELSTLQIFHISRIIKLKERELEHLLQRTKEMQLAPILLIQIQSITKKMRFEIRPTCSSFPFGQQCAETLDFLSKFVFQLEECNKQEDSWECGYYVMSWIRTIIRAAVKDEWIESINGICNLHVGGVTNGPKFLLFIRGVGEDQEDEE